MYWLLLLLIPLAVFIYRWIRIIRIDKKIREWQKLSHDPDREQPPRPEGFEYGDKLRLEDLKPVPYLFGFIKIPKRMGPRPAGMPVYDELTKQATLMALRPWFRAFCGFEWVKEEDNPNPTLNIILISLLVALVCSVVLCVILVGVMYLLNFLWAYKAISAFSILVTMVILILWSAYKE